MSKELNKAPVEQAGGDERAGLRAAAQEAKPRTVSYRASASHQHSYIF
ncbi:hypothetical protein KZ851_02965 [Pseudomonas aeruginosa]|nr:hypothetical protein [Pseudomonas aeruginosa]MBW6333086.1 hypothetical protein [Pseudomonas aeruginosa]